MTIPELESRIVPGDLGTRAAAFDLLAAGAAVLDGAGVIVDTNESWRLFTHLNDGDRAATGVGVDYLAVCDRASAAGTRPMGVSIDLAQAFAERLGVELELVVFDAAGKSVESVSQEKAEPGQPGKTGLA
jgi:ABC-type amino acid transport substrate-binding protein